MGIPVFQQKHLTENALVWTRVTARERAHIDISEFHALYKYSMYVCMYVVCEPTVCLC